MQQSRDVTTWNSGHNVIGCNKQQKEQVKVTRKLFHIMGAPTIRNFKHIIKSNQIRNCPMTLDDIDGAEKICRKDILHVKRRTTGWNPTTTTIVNIAMPKEFKGENKNITLHIDIVHINKIGFMATTSHPLHHQGCKHIENVTKDSFCDTLDEPL